MNLEEAKQLRNDYWFLIGQEAEGFDATINDVIIRPSLANEYEVLAVYDMGGSDIAYEPVNTYKNRLPK